MGDLFRSLIQTCELSGINPFDYTEVEVPPVAACSSSQFYRTLKSITSPPACKLGCYNVTAMFDLFRLWFGAILRVGRSHRSLLLENLALRQQLVVLKRKHPKPRLGPFDKLFWVVARRFWSRWREVLILVRPETVVRWHQAGFKLYWAMLCKVRKRVGGRRITNEIRELIFRIVASLDRKRLGQDC